MTGEPGSAYTVIFRKREGDGFVWLRTAFEGDLCRAEHIAAAIREAGEEAKPCTVCHAEARGIRIMDSDYPEGRR